MINNTFLLLSFFLLLSTFGFSQQLINATINHDGETRTYRVFLPSSYQTGQNLPMVFNLHGTYLNGTQQIAYSELNTVAEQEDFIVVIPEGLVGTTFFGLTATHWNCYWGTGVDDLGFLNLLIDRVYTDYNIDLSRIYCTGFSNGGYMSHRLACELSHRIAGIASVAGSVVNEQLDSCATPQAVPVLQINGTNDAVVVFDGVPGGTPSTLQLVNHWVNINNCTTSPDTILIPNINTSDSSTARRLEYNNGDNGSKVWLYIVDSGGHSWPGAPSNFNGAITNRDFNASEHIWDFFEQFQHPNPAAGTILSIKNIAMDHIHIIARPINKALTAHSDLGDILTVRLFDLLGKTIVEEHYGTPQGEIVMNIPAIQTGVYIATVETAKGRFTQKVFF